ncbi:MAG: hypothetical protein B6D59_03560 [Campylobacteraceae bacterium 4484_4]|nr:MAG: hypothetical protein B6D59_03560 [Campylobacteraceae bacterium 4484_4]
MQKREDIDLAYFKNVLEEKKADLEQQIASVNNEIETVAAQGDINDVEDLAALKIQNTRDRSVLESLKNQLEEVKEALKRIEEGSYGICEKTGKPIPIERLKANPTARTVVEAE